MDINLFKKRSSIWNKINSSNNKNINTPVPPIIPLVNDRKQIEAYTHLRRVPERGKTARVEILSNGRDKNYIVKKQYIQTDKPFGDYAQPYNAMESFKSEVTALSLLYGCEHFPKLLYYDEETMTIYMTYCGKDLGHGKPIPHDWKDQMRTIYRTLKSRNIYNNDIYEGNFCIKQNKIYMIDFGFAKGHVDLNFKNLTLRDINESESLDELLMRVHDNSKAALNSIHV